MRASGRSYERRPGDGKGARLRVAVVHGCFSEGRDSILSTFSREALRAKLQDN